MKGGKENFKSVILQVMTILSRRYHVHMSHLKILLTSPARLKVLAKWFLAGCPLNGFPSLREGRMVTVYEQILQDHFFKPVTIEQIWGVSYSPEQRVQLEKSLPSLEAVSQLQEMGFVLIPSLPEGKLSSADIAALYSLAGHGELECGVSTESFWGNSKSKIAPATWIAICPEGIRATLDQRWCEQQAILRRNKLQSVCFPDLLYVLLTYETWFGESFLCGGMRSRTSSVDISGCNAYLMKGNGQPMASTVAPQFHAMDMNAPCRIKL